MSYTATPMEKQTNKDDTLAKQWQFVHFYKREEGEPAKIHLELGKFLSTVDLIWTKIYICEIVNSKSQTWQWEAGNEAKMGSNEHTL